MTSVMKRRERRTEEEERGGGLKPELQSVTCLCAGADVLKLKQTQEEEETSTDFRLGLLHHGNCSPTTCSLWFDVPERRDNRRNLQGVWLGSCPSCFEVISVVPRDISAS